MTARFRVRQALVIARLELKRVFLSRRSLWIYGLAMLPAALFLVHALQLRYELSQARGGGVVAPAVIEAIERGMSEKQVLELAGPPGQDREHTIRRSSRRKEKGREIVESREVRTRRMIYFDGSRRAYLWFEDGILRSKEVRPLLNFTEDREVYAGVFQYFYLRLAIFFGCLGIFLNLFRGEMLDKTLHFWLLAPARREVLLAGKFLAGWAAASVVFTGGAMLAFAAMLWPHTGAGAEAYWQGAGAVHAARYALAAAMGCAGYGSLFLAASLWIRNPIVPAAVLLLWEASSGFLPELLQKFSVLYYLQSLCPVPAPMEQDVPTLLKLILAPAPPLPAWLAALGLCAFSALVLWAAAAGVRRLEIHYSTD
jgi:hypothetical protein